MVWEKKWLGRWVVVTDSRGSSCSYSSSCAGSSGSAAAAATTTVVVASKIIKLIMVTIKFMITIIQQQHSKARTIKIVAIASANRKEEQCSLNSKASEEIIKT